jgi:hypothetical protein
MRDEHSEVSSRLPAPQAIERGERFADASGAANVNPFVAGGSALDPERHAAPESKRYACRRCGGRNPDCLSCLASVLARKHGGESGPLMPSSAGAARRGV